MKHLLIISFDLIRDGEPDTSLSVASLIAYLKQDKRYGHELVCSHISINMIENLNASPTQITQQVMNLYDLEQIDFIALSCYVWSEFLINPLIKNFRHYGFAGAIILGGYQISYSDNLRSEYPDCQIFIKGYAEESLRQAAFIKPSSEPIILNEEPDFSQVPSAYLSGELKIENQQSRVRFETKRGCPYRCSFCAHRDLQRNLVYRHAMEKTVDELAFFKSKDVKKINVLDPVFNMGKEYLCILEKMAELDLKSLISLQSRFENIVSRNGERFLELCSSLNVLLEFGLQTIQEKELAPINRRNNKDIIENILERLNNLGIPYEVSLIYGLPNQTYKSFEASVNFLKSHECKVIKAFPLMLLKGTELFANRDKWSFREKVMGDFHIPVVVSSNSFDESEWQHMRDLAESLEPCERY